MPPRSKDLFTRVVAIAAQGVINAHPQRTLSFPTFHYYIRANVFEWDDDLLAASLGVRDRLRKHIDAEMGATEFVPDDRGQVEGQLVRFHWVQRRFDPHGSDAFHSMSQEEVEKLYASIFTHPYPVTRVSDAAQAFAEEIVRGGLPYVFTKRWRG